MSVASTVSPRNCCSTVMPARLIYRLRLASSQPLSTRMCSDLIRRLILPRTRRQWRCSILELWRDIRCWRLRLETPRASSPVFRRLTIMATARLWGRSRFTTSETLRSKGTVQASTWSFTRPSAAVAEKPWFVVVTRNDPPWGELLSTGREPYALAVLLGDRAAVQPQLYTRIEARLRARVQA